ncbi:Metallo-dependent phosphatase-like protein [Xylariaceae sp. FL1019]|nr:Metallo-dependent phosphatase-like protein [Xylariaceae sp. FL1019]
MSYPVLPTSTTSQQKQTRRTRFVCISDTHNATVKLPKGDVLIHCGDLTNQGSFSELSKQVEWLEKADFECKIVVAGNHDLTLDSEFFLRHGDIIHNRVQQNPKKCQALIKGSPTLTYLEHESRIFKLSSPSGPRTTCSVFGSPYSPAWGTWAFQFSRDDGGATASALWDQIPLDTDILITHGPALTHCDKARTNDLAGCESLHHAYWRVRPRLALCGHIHEARGVERVKWDLNLRHGELGRTGWEDPHPDTEKNALVDLTMKGGAPLDNDGGSHKTDRAPQEIPKAPRAMLDLEKECREKLSIPSAPKAMLGLKSKEPGIPTAPKAMRERQRDADEMDVDSPKVDEDAAVGRLGRRETCVINCAIRTSIWPHARRLNKPIVVDIDLPIWEDEDPQHMIISE